MHCGDNMHYTSLDDFLKNFNNESSTDIFYMSENGDATDATREQILFASVHKGHKEYFALKNIHLDHMNRGKGVFTHIISIMESMNRRVMVDTIVNPKVKSILLSRGWIEYSYYHNGGLVSAMIYS